MNKKVRLISHIRNAKFTQLIYMTYVLNFPDGDQWVRQKQLSAHDLEVELKNMIAEHSRDKAGRASDWRNRAIALWKVGECWWKDNLGVEHLILIERTKRKEKWGVSKAGMGEIKTGVSES